MNDTRTQRKKRLLQYSNTLETCFPGDYVYVILVYFLCLVYIFPSPISRKIFVKHPYYSEASTSESKVTLENIVDVNPALHFFNIFRFYSLEKKVPQLDFDYVLMHQKVSFLT